MTNDVPAIAPHEPCIVCFRGDTTTALALIGSPEWQIAGLINLGVPESEAFATIEHARTDEHYSEKMPVRVCAACAQRAGMQVEDTSAGVLPAYIEQGREQS
jgi:hypothetical protein